MKTRTTFPPFASRLIAVWCLALLATAAAAAPAITVPLPSVAVARSGVPFSLEVVASGTGTLRYQWRHFGVNLPGATAAVLSLAAPEMVDAGWYDVMVTDDSGAVLSRPTRLRVAPAGGYAGAVEVDWTFRPVFEVLGSVQVVAPLADGSCYAAGNFTRIGGESRASLVRLRPDGEVDTAFMPARSAAISALLAQPGERLLLGGNFSAGGDVRYNRLERINADGTPDASFNPGDGCDGEVSALAAQPDGKILVAGSFSHVNGVSRGCIARLATDGTLDGTFATGDGFVGDVYCLLRQPDGKIVVGGRFSTYNGVTCNRIARLEADGTMDTSFKTGDGFNPYVTSLALQSDGKIVVGGYFWNYNGIARNNIVRLNADGSLDTTFVVGTGFNSSVNEVLVPPGGGVIVAGAFSSYNGTACKSIVRLTDTGGLDPLFDPGTGFDGGISSLALRADGRLQVGGSFLHYNGQPAATVACLQENGSWVGGLAGECRARGTVGPVQPAAGGRWVVTGDFSWVNGVPRNRIARLNADGTLDGTFDPGTGFNGTVNTLAAHAGGRIVAAGAFTSYNGTERYRIARLNADGSLDTTFNPRRGFDKDVKTIAVQRDGKVLAGGSFWRCDNLACAYIGRLYQDGGRDTGFDAGGGFDHRVDCLEVQGDGRILVGGAFDSFDGVTRPHFARLLAYGGLDTGFVGGTGFNSTVETVAIQSSGRILAAGTFSTFKDKWCRTIAGLTDAGDLDPALRYNGAISYAGEVALLADDRILVGGGAVGADGVSRYRIERLSAEGRREATLVEPTTGAGVVSFQYCDDGRLLVAGVAATDGDTMQSGLVAYVPRRLGYSEWVAQFGLPLAQRDPLATPAGDGVSNLLKFALGVPPLESATAHLPTLVGGPTDPQEGDLGLVFGRNADGRGFACTLQVSGDLVVWEDVEAVEETLGTAPDGALLVRLRETAPAGAARRFARLKVSLQP